MKLLLWLIALGLYFPANLWHPGRDKYFSLKELRDMARVIGAQEVKKE